MSSWSDLWKILDDLEFSQDTYLWRFYQRLLDDYNFKNKKIIEIGCGLGVNTVFMGLKGAKLTFFDKTKEALQIVKKSLDKYSLDAELVQGDAFDYNFTKEFDLSHSEGLAEHFLGKQRQKIVEVHADCLKKGGKAVIIVPNKRSHPYRIGKFLAQKAGNWIYTGEYPFKAKELEYRMNKAGLNTQKVLGGEGVISFYWLFCPLYMCSKRLITKGYKIALESKPSDKMFKLNFDNWYANRYGRIIGCVGTKPF